MAAKKSATPRTPKPRQARSYPTLEAWIGNELNQERLKALLTDEVLIAACHYISDQFKVTPEDIRIEGAELIARKTAMHSVVSQFPDLLKKLIKRPTAQVDMQPWAHIHPDIK